MNVTSSRLRLAQRVLWQVLFANLAVAIAKVVYGLMTNAASMTADGYHSISDASSNIIGMIGIGLASQPRDEDHPYGHKKYESIAAMIIGMMLFGMAVHVFADALKRWTSPDAGHLPVVTIISFLIMIVTMIVNFWVMLYEHRQGERLRSQVLIADSMHTRGDLLVSTSVLVTLVTVRLGFPLIDVVMAMMIAGFIAHSGYAVTKSSLGALMDEVVFDPQEVARVVRSIPQVRSCHEIRTRGRADDVHIDLHVMVDPKMDVETAHEVSHTIERRLKRELSGVVDVIVHVEPEEDDHVDP